MCALLMDMHLMDDYWSTMFFKVQETQQSRYHTTAIKQYTFFSLGCGLFTKNDAFLRIMATSISEEQDCNALFKAGCDTLWKQLLIYTF